MTQPTPTGAHASIANPVMANPARRLGKWEARRGRLAFRLRQIRAEVAPDVAFEDGHYWCIGFKWKPGPWHVLLRLKHRGSR